MISIPDVLKPYAKSLAPLAAFLGILAEAVADLSIDGNELSKILVAGGVLAAVFGLKNTPK